MTHEPTITCYTLFEIPDKGDRNTIRNWNTLVQTLSLRTQPIIIDFPHCINDSIRNHKFGQRYKYSNIKTIDVWQFTFTAQDLRLYEQADNPIAALIIDCNFVPMVDNRNIIIPPKCLVTAGELCNTYFVFTP